MLSQFALCLLAFTAAGQVDRKVIEVPGWPSGGHVPLSSGIMSHGMVLASGMGGLNFSTMKVVPGGAPAETKQALSNIQQIMQAGGSDMADVAACAVYLKDIKDFGAVNEVYATFFPKPRPARVAMQVGALAGDLSVEIKCTAVAAGTHRQEVVVPGWPDMTDKFPFSTGIIAGDYVFASGVVGVDFPTGKMVEGGAEAEARQALTNVRQIMEAAGSDMSNVIECAVYLRDTKDFLAMNKAYSEFFEAPPPSRVAMQVVALAGAAVVEIQCLAALPSVGRKLVVVPHWPETPVPLSPAITSGGFLFASGMQGLNLTTMKLVPGGIYPETAQTLSLIKQVVEAGGSSMDDVVECAVYLADMKDFMAMNSVYGGFFPKLPPARVAMQVGAILGGAAVEIQCSAALPAATIVI